MRVVKGLATILVVLVAVVLVMFVMGSRLPVSHTASASVLVHAPQARVWQMIEDVQSQPQWRPGLIAVQLLPAQNGHPCWLETQSMGKMPLCELLTAAPSTRIAAIADPTLPYSGTWTYQLTAVDDQDTNLLITENGDTRPALFRFLGHYVFHEDTQIKQFEGGLQKAASEP